MFNKYSLYISVIQIRLCYGTHNSFICTAFLLTFARIIEYPCLYVYLIGRMWRLINVY